MKAKTVFKLACVSSILLFQLTNSQLDIGDKPKIPPPNKKGGGGSSPPGGNSPSPQAVGKSSPNKGGKSASGDKKETPSVPNPEDDAEFFGHNRRKPGGGGLFAILKNQGAKKSGTPPLQDPVPLSPQMIPQSVCYMGVDPGFCNLMLGRWYYDHRYHRCLPFLYTGCGGNSNNFYSIRKCEETSLSCHSFSPGYNLYGGLSPGALNPINPLARLAPFLGG